MMLSRLLRSSLHSIALPWVLAAFLLVAQQGALTHALSHAGGHAHKAVATNQTAPDTAAGQHGSGRQVVSGQCALDLVYCQVLGGFYAASAPMAVPDSVFQHGTQRSTFLVVVNSLPYFAQGPPALL